jgi:hypothetical protein
MNKFETSDFVFYDNIIHGVFGLGHISFADLKNDLIADSRLYLRKYFESLADFKYELSSLSQQSYQPLEPPVQAVTQHQAKFISFKNFTVFLPTSFVTISILVLLFLRPQFIQNTFSSGKTETVEIQQIKIDRHLEDKDQPIPNAEQVIANTENTAKPADFANTVKSKNSPIASTALATATIKSDQKPPIFAELPQDKLKVIAASSGGLFRGRLIVTDVQQVIGVVREKIINLGGKKAGEVELGWMKNETTSYFHFSFPEENNADLENYLKQFGKVQLVFEPHPRMMPKGIKRYIIEIKQNE